MWVPDYKKYIYFAPGGCALQAGGRLLQHEGGDPVAGFRSGLFRKLRGCGHARPPPAGKLRQCDQQRKPQWRVHDRTEPNRAGAFRAQLLQQRPFPCLHFWCNHWYVVLRGCFFVHVHSGVWLIFALMFDVSLWFVSSLQHPVTAERDGGGIRVW